MADIFYRFSSEYWLLFNIIFFGNFSEKYFSMSRKQCKEALDIYKKFVVRMDGVAKFLRTAEVMHRLIINVALSENIFFNLSYVNELIIFKNCLFRN